ncbi:hypothetical protein CDL15_Pgr027171 [Punica granatum]|uniref:Uncharacterized protein n=1 Tax=Punica granatum TaxID=22663 RepID=A0A218XAJ9_PUNGR|nr:hypothetical protein CDL15_Pgr027171 [Punica granatum]PKI45076.1 hypothetical protein CRG98_034538 [Punica granatum]
MDVSVDWLSGGFGLVTSEVEAVGGGERDLHEMGMLEVAVPGKGVDDGDAVVLGGGFGSASSVHPPSISAIITAHQLTGAAADLHQSNPRRSYLVFSESGEEYGSRVERVKSDPIRIDFWAPLNNPRQHCQQQ